MRAWACHSGLQEREGRGERRREEEEGRGQGPFSACTDSDRATLPSFPLDSLCFSSSAYFASPAFWAGTAPCATERIGEDDRRLTT